MKHLALITASLAFAVPLLARDLADPEITFNQQ